MVHTHAGAEEAAAHEGGDSAAMITRMDGEIGRVGASAPTLLELSDGKPAAVQSLQ